jgi:glycosyltransferase involved in cell wall biosynthesis
MVATDVGGVRDIIIPGTTGLTAPAGNIDALANAVLTLLDDQSYAKQLRQNARQLVKERFSIDIGCQRLLAIYGQVCRQARTRKAGP